MIDIILAMIVAGGGAILILAILRSAFKNHGVTYRRETPSSLMVQPHPPDDNICAGCSNGYAYWRWTPADLNGRMWLCGRCADETIALRGGFKEIRTRT